MGGKTETGLSLHTQFGFFTEQSLRLLPFSVHLKENRIFDARNDNDFFFFPSKRNMTRGTARFLPRWKNNKVY